MKFESIKSLQMSSEWSRIMEDISDLAETLTDIKLDSNQEEIFVQVEGEDYSVYTKKAQDIYNDYYDQIESGVFEALGLDFYD